MAVYLANQDDADSRLCPHLQLPAGPSDAVKSLRFGLRYTAPRSDATDTAHGVSGPKLNRSKRVQDRVVSKGGQVPTPVSPTTPYASRRGSDQNHIIKSDDGAGKGDKLFPPGTTRSIQITEKPISKDYRSFAANVFGTVAFKMIEWLTPNNMSAMEATSERVAAGGNSLDIPEGSRVNPTPSSSQYNMNSPLSAPSIPELGGQDVAHTGHEWHTSSNPTAKKEPSEYCQRVYTEQQGPPSHQRRNSNAQIRTSSVSKPQTKVVPEPLVESITDEKGPLSTKPHPAQSEKVPKGLVRPPSIARTPSQVTENDVHAIRKSNILEPPISHAPTNEHCIQMDGVNGEETPSSTETTRSLDILDEEQQHILSNGDNLDSLDSTSELDSYLPQTLSRLNLQAINFICDVLQEDATSERHLLEPTTISSSIKRTSSRLKSWKRKGKSQAPYPQDLKLQWKLFAEQSIFHVLSDPRALLDSFTSSNGMVDSQTLWYCMLRLTRVAPSLVFDSLWIALASLFSPPKALQFTRSPTSKMFSGSQKSFTNAEAASLMSVCFHALIAAAPLVTDTRQLNEMSRTRAHGLPLAGGGEAARESIPLSLQYEDAFTDDLALRLARRLLRVIPTRRYFDELIELDLHLEDEVKEPDILDILLSHLDSSTQSSLNFSKAERTLHEKRVPILLLDWARAVMLHEWEEKPDVPGDGPFGGALSLIAAMC